MLPARPVARALRNSTSSPLILRAAASSSASSSAPSKEHLDWDSFLRLRRLRRRYNLASSVLTSFIGTSAGMGYLANKEIDVTQTIFGMDPLMMFGFATVGCGAAGWLAGPSLAGGVFNLVKKRWVGQIAEVS